MTKVGTQLVDGVISCLGGASEIDGRISWAGPDVGRYESFNCYLIQNEEKATLIDTGVAAHRDTLLEQLHSSLRHESLEVVVTRRQEFDSESMLSAVMLDLPVPRVHLRDSVRREDNFDTVVGLSRDYPVEFCHIVNGSTIDLGAGMVLKTIETPLRLLSTVWMYEPANKILFTSDAFGHLTLAAPGDPRISDPDNDDTTIDTVRARTLQKLWWLPVAETDTIVAGLRAIFDENEVEMIAPGHGCAIVGADLVRRHLDLVIDVVRESRAVEPIGG